MSWTRRSFLTTSTAALAAAAVPGRLAQAARANARWLGMPPAGSPELKAFALRALEVARSAGATYADVQIRSSRNQRWYPFQAGWYPYPWEQYTGGIGVRALVNGYWGFSGVDGVPTADLMVKLGRDAAGQARIAATGKPRSAELAPTAVVRDGHWVTPIEIDPFTVSADEIIDFCGTIVDDINLGRYRNDAQLGLRFIKDDCTFASTDGSFISQTLYTSGAFIFGVGVETSVTTEREGGWAFNCMTPAGAGWEYILRAPIREELPEVLEGAFEVQRPPVKQVTVDRYDVVYDASAVAGLLDITIGAATELDRAMGYEANGLGTSFLNDPLAMLGNYQIGSPLVTVTANRSMPRGAATVGWDAEGVPAADTTLVTKGIVTDFQTTREAASWIAPYYQQRGIPIRSNGCAGIETPTTPVSQVPPNLTLAPGAQTMSFNDLVRDTKKGIAIMGGRCEADHQSLNGSGYGFVREIQDGKLGAVISNALYLFRAPDLWKNVTALGGPETVQRFGRSRRRSRGPDEAYHTVSTVPIAVKNVVLTDQWRRA